VLNFGHNKAKDIFENPKGHENELVRIFCAVKCMMGWHMQEVGNTCRERCGGGSYLTVTTIPESVTSCHSSMTAEGDNRVLMQKVVKDLFADVQKKIHRMPKLTQCPIRQIPNLKSVATLETLANLIYYKEQAFIKSMGKLMQKLMME